MKDEAVRLFSRDAEFGIKTQIERGDGSEFDALREFTAGMDRRAIDWKHSAVTATCWPRNSAPSATTISSSPSTPAA